MFVKHPTLHHTMWQPKPRTPEQVKAESNDKRAAILAKRTPTSGRQTIMSDTVKRTGQAQA